MADVIPPDGRTNRAGGPRGRPRGHPGRKPDSPRPGTGTGPGNKADRARSGKPPAPRESAPPAPVSYPSARQAYAAIDLGTNNCRLLIARPHDESFVVIDAFSRVVRLGEGLA